MRHDEMVRFRCEECGIEFEVSGHLVAADREGGLEFVPTFGDDIVRCPNDEVPAYARRLRTYPGHDISLEGGQ